MKSLQGRFGTISRHQFRPFVNLALLRVQTAKSANLEQEQEAKDEDEPPLEAPALHGPFACILGSRVFVFHNETNLNAFCREPYRYVPRTDAFAGLIPAVQGMALAPDSGQVPPHSRVAAQGALGVGLFVLGGAKANEVAMKVAEDLGMEHLTIDLAVKDLLEVEDSVEVDEGKRIVVREQNDLVDRVAAAVAAGGLSDDLKVEVLMEVVRRARAATRG
ncbi:hypothetical protein M427DRAFT_402291 [Gonapodya prolifera JEL478]|uniref:Uncharacterized protein n=1 Tax=Gonapodya prolifera (strain JEL478) TaxID=1344416 RepID=A0A139AU48_GONPJ|nr:hypothetical protein M427DRAFT_402291 [Gonapodya prolifera JEL478]|eukprot:KXS20103.1 hypothetical protein M427DRAFT_402291 [Gonapodya prolifera JEL478]